MENEFQVSNIRNTTWQYPARYTDMQPVGQGAYGTVCEGVFIPISSAFDKELNRRVAIKKLSRPFYSDEYGKRTYRELKLLKHMDHGNIICLIDVFTSHNSAETLQDIYLVTPLLDADLNAIIRTQVLSENHIKFIIYQILRALKYLHSADIIHRDLKPTNIAMNVDCELKILDFGLARQRVDEMTGYVATRYYRAPEIMLRWMHYNNTVDVWSVGCIMAELMTRKVLFPGNNYLDQLNQIMKLTGKPDSECMQKIESEDAIVFLNNIDSPRQNFADVFPGYSADAIDLLEKTLLLDTDRRITAVQALEHPYMSDYHDENDEPISLPYFDPCENIPNISVEQWKCNVWEELQNFVPKLNSLTTPDEDD